MSAAGKPPANQVGLRGFPDMKLKFLIFSAALLIASVMSGYVKSVSSSRQESRQQTTRPTLKQIAREAKGKGEGEVKLHGLITNKAQFTNLTDALNAYHLMKVELVDKKSMIENESIYSWYKFKIIDDISQAKTAYDFSFMTPPLEMLPLQRDEVLVSADGGVVMIDGIEVSSRELGEPVFDINKQYLLFLCLDPATKIATVNLGAAGVFSVDGADIIAPFNKNKRYVYDALGSNSISVVKRKLQRRGK